MALQHYDVTLSGNTRAVTAHTPIAYLRIENPTGNADVLVGDKDLSATSFGATVTAGPNNARVIGPFPHGILNLDEVYFRGTDTQVIHLLAVTP